MTGKEDQAWNEYSERFRTEALPKMLDSSIFLSISSQVGEFDVKQATELGAMLLIDKPLLLLVPKDREIGVRLRRAADIVLDNFDVKDAGSQERLMAAMNALKRVDDANN